MKTAFYYATRASSINQCYAQKSLEKILVRYSNSFDIFYSANNTEGLSKNYNIILEKYKNDYECIVFLHDDVYVDDFNILEKLERAHKLFDIVGLAGGLNPVIKKPALWHLMCGGRDSTNLRGAVAHPCSKNEIMFTSFGPMPARVAILDGLFLSVNVKAAVEAGWKFNENYTFHHYDIASSIDANRKKLRLGVAPIWVLHSSPGLLNPNDETFLSSQDTFIKEYSGS